VDIGVHVDGYIADTAFSMTFNPEFSGLKQAADEALANAIKAIKPKVKVSAVGGIIQSVVERFGFKPIRNLTGHKVLRYMLHAGKFIPNVSFLDGVKIEEGEVYAVEPFVTTQRGGGEVRHANVAYIYRLLKEKPPKSEDAKKFYEVIKRNFASLPFASRWALKAFASVNAEAIFNDLVRQKFVGGYPVLVEVAGQPISQSEHTVLVTKEGCEILTV
jgi:methionyl aminopeptidase